MTTQPDGTAVRVPGTHCVSPYPKAEPGMSAPVKTAMAMTERARVPRLDLDLMLDMTRRPKTFHQSLSTKIELADDPHDQPEPRLLSAAGKSVRCYDRQL